LHETIVDEDIWSRVQDLLAEQTQRRKAPSADSHSFLAGKLFDDRGHRMGPSHAAKGGRRWRYYISRAVLKGRSQDAGSVTRVPAAEIEKQVSQAVRRALSHCRTKNAISLRLVSFQAAATAARHVFIAAARQLRRVPADVRWRWTLKML
jgi:hypothetical protein